MADRAYASDTLLQRCGNLSSRDAGLAAEIVFGCLRYQAQLDFLIGRYSGRSPAGQDAAVLTALRAAIYQIRNLDRIPAHAAVHDSVEFIKTRRRKASSFVNAVLRKVNRDPVPWPDEATALSCPAWLLARWEAHFGPETARNIAAAALEKPAAYVRVSAGAEPPENAVPTSVPGCFRLVNGSEAQFMPTSRRLQDIGSQAIVPLLSLQPQHRYLDLCAAPGNKTLQALEALPRFAVACDISERRLRTVPPVCPRVVLDAAADLPFRTGFDRIFIDAPCSGTGTLARNPEIKWRVQAEDFQRFGDKQLAIAVRALEALDVRGKLVYATCSLEPEENESVVAALLKSSRERGQSLRLVEESWRIPGRDEGDGFYAAVLEP